MASGAVILRDFDPDIQREIQFHAPIRAAFFDSQYTDENDAELTWICSPENDGKKREVKYGNNIAVLFKALYHCRQFYGCRRFWGAVAVGWKASGGMVEAVARILTKARRAYRDGPGRARDACQTARAVDQWIDYLDSCPVNQQVHPNLDPSDLDLLRSIAKDFYAQFRHKMVNAARIPKSPMGQRSSNSQSALPDKPPVPTEPSAFRRARLPERPPPVHTEAQGYDRNDPVQSSRKRSRSPSTDENRRAKRPHQTTPDTTRREEHAQQDYRHQQSDSAQSEPRPPISREDTFHIRGSALKEAESKRTDIGASPAPTNESHTTFKYSTTSEDLIMERQAATAAVVMQLQQSNNEIKADLASFKGLMENLTDSVAMIVDHVESLRKDVTELKQQGEDDGLRSECLVKLETLVQKAAGDVMCLKGDVMGLKTISEARTQKQEEYQQQDQAKTATNLELMQEMRSSIKTMADEISELKFQQKQAPPPVPPVQLDDIKALMEGLFAQQEAKIQSQVEGLLASHETKIKSRIEGLFDQHEVNMKPQFTGFLGEQTDKIDTLKQEIIKMKSEVISAISTASATPVAPASKHENRVSLARVLSAAEDDIKQHKHYLEYFYNHLNQNGTSISGANVDWDIYRLFWAPRREIRGYSESCAIAAQWTTIKNPGKAAPADNQWSRRVSIELLKSKLFADLVKNSEILSLLARRLNVLRVLRKVKTKAIIELAKKSKYVLRFVKFRIAYKSVKTDIEDYAYIAFSRR
ncbi:hypothetical protein V8F20_009185 [Naviculisporaceae sp. PSN 640]